MSEAARDLASAYAGVEDLGSFEDPDALREYRESVLARSAPQADFLIEDLPAPAAVLEVACGNGRLLIELPSAACSERASASISPSPGSSSPVAGPRTPDSRRSGSRSRTCSRASSSRSATTRRSASPGPSDTSSRWRRQRAASGYNLRNALNPGGLLCLELTLAAIPTAGRGGGRRGPV
jgi:hypothetical protein